MRLIAAIVTLAMFGCSAPIGAPEESDSSVPRYVATPGADAAEPIADAGAVDAADDAPGDSGDSGCKTLAMLVCTPWDHVHSPDITDGGVPGAKVYYSSCIGDANSYSIEEYKAALTECIQAGGYVSGAP